MLEINNLTFKYEDGVDNVLENISFSVNKNEVTVLLGKSGEGKSTILNLIANWIEKKHEGKITIDGKETNKYNIFLSDVSMISQDYELFNSLSIFENIKLAYINSSRYYIDILKANNLDTTIDIEGLNIRELSNTVHNILRKNKIKFTKKDKKILIKNKIENILNRLNIDKDLKTKFEKMSKGQKQRVAICAALIKEPKLIIMDEPFSSLDTINIQEIINLINEYKRDSISFLIITHKQQEIEKYADKIVYLSNKKVYVGKTKEEIMIIENDTSLNFFDSNSNKISGKYFNLKNDLINVRPKDIIFKKDIKGEWSIFKQFKNAYDIYDIVLIHDLDYIKVNTFSNKKIDEKANYKLELKNEK